MRYVFSGWSCSGLGCYTGTQNPSSVSTGGNNSIIAERALWTTEYLLNVSSSPSSAGATNPSGTFWADAGSVVGVTQQSAGQAWIFAYWSFDSEVNAGSYSAYTMTMNSPHSLIANFVKLNITSQLLNVTSADGLNMRNPDGTFYSGDEFRISSTISVVAGGPLPDNVIPVVTYFYSVGVLKQLSTENGSAEFQVLPTATYARQMVTATGNLENEVDNVMIQSPATSPEPFAVVQYRPIFSYFTFMEYNDIGSSTYQRPFVTLIRYDGNEPGYSYTGDENTDPFNAYNSTMERAFLNNFSFSVEGWSISTNMQNPSSSLDVLSYPPHDSLTVHVQMLNKSYPDVITWNNRMWKFYFVASFPSIQNYISNDGIVYFNITESAWYSQGTIRSSDYNTSYLYEPIFYNGYLIFKAANPDTVFNISIVAHNPDPLDEYLINEVTGIFGNDSQVIDSFQKDLYAAYSTTMVLKPYFENSTTEVFLVNQTDIMNGQSSGAPYFTITVSGVPGATTYVYNSSNLERPVTTSPFGQEIKNTTYDVSDEFSLFSMNDFSPSSPFDNFIAYYLTQTDGFYILAQPASFSFSGHASYLVRTYDNPEAPFFVSQEPGNLAKDYAMLYGQNLTVDLNFGGGGITSLVVSSDGYGSSFYEATLVVGQGSGVDRLVVTSDGGEILYNQSIVGSNALAASFNPPEFGGTYAFAFPVYSNGTVSIDLSGVLGSVDKIVEIPVISSYGSSAPPGIISEIMNVVWYLLVPVLFVFWLLVVWFRLRNEGSRRTSESQAPYPLN